MTQDGVIVGLDIGTTMVKVVVAQNNGGRFNVIATGSAAGAGLKRGVIVDINKTAEAIKQAISQASKKANVSIEEVVVGLPANQISIQKVSGLVSIENQNKQITGQDVVNVTTQALNTLSLAEQTPVEFLPSQFIVDGFDGIKDPTDMIGVRLEVQGLVYLAPNKVVDGIKTAVKKAGLSIAAMDLAPMALAPAFLSDAEQNFGAILIDLAGGQSTASVIHDHKVKYMTVDYEGGLSVSKDISTVLSISKDEAEAVKVKYGSADSKQASAEQIFYVDAVGRTEKKPVDEKYLASIMEARFDQIFDRLDQQLDNVGADDLPGGYIITGGSAATPGLLSKAQEHFGQNVQVARPNQIGLRHPSFARALAFASFEAFQSDLQKMIKAVLMGKQIEQAPEAENYYQADKDDAVIQTTEEDDFYIDEKEPKEGFFKRMKTSLTSLFAETNDED
ncbi:cell division protein FtsA [Fructobacillus sp. M1-13]|uniref:Cell division protein FtsA n=1 Tax=Fructobacillus papyriferae TaxID=2713171 RepID=A0ABS5QPV0_9LACO|nr:cell division protein FtsA [Fructobacillus papyriferae]MBS9334505.1 cell division protein FtsA [Fructobacillus papyriferae]MCD2158494.1 cell division protein FtsA [Fructobacillus papyriferae]